MNQRRHSDDMRSRRDSGFEGGRDMGQSRGRQGSQWRDQGDDDFAASRQSDEWARESGRQSGDRYEREDWDGTDRDRYGDYGQNRQPGMRGGYGTSNEGYGYNRGYQSTGGYQGGSGYQGNGGYRANEGNGRTNWNSGGSQGWSGESSGYGDRGESYGGSQDYRGSQNYRSGQGVGNGHGRVEESRYAGMGPKGYRRSDERIKEDISDRLTEHGSIDPSEVEVEVQGGDVTLSGTVADREQKRRAEDIAESCSGVGNVTNNIRCENRMPSRSASGQSRQNQSGQSQQSQSAQAGKKNT
jgi:osmotically-inducible protein OsmY